MNNQKNKTIAIVLAILLGGLGAHKFYLERPGNALLYVLFCWTLIPMFVSLCETLMYVFMSEVQWDRYTGFAK
jgi:TM2 domain-containing membrane protein YozV